MCKRQRKTGPGTGTGRKHQSTEFDHVLSSPWSPKPPVCAAMENGRDALGQLLVALDGAKGNRTDLSCMLHRRALPPDALSPACSSQAPGLPPKSPSAHASFPASIRSPAGGCSGHAHPVVVLSSAPTGTCLGPTQMYYRAAFTPVTYSAGADEVGLCCFPKVTKCSGIWREPRGHISH